MPDPTVAEIVEEERAMLHDCSTDPVICKIKEERVVAEKVRDKKGPIDPKLLRAIVDGDLKLFKRLSGNQAATEQDVESIGVSPGDNGDLLGVTIGGDTALHVVAGTIEKPRQMAPFSEHITSPVAVGLVMDLYVIVVLRICSIIVYLVSPVLFLIPFARIVIHIAAVLVNAYFLKDHAEMTLVILKKTWGKNLILCFPHIRILYKRIMHLKIAEIIYCNDPTLLCARNHAMEETPLHCAAKAGNLEMASLLIQFALRDGQKKKVLMAKNKVGETALHEAARSGSSDVMEELLGTDVNLSNVVDDDGISPLYLAVVTGCFDVVDVLISSNHPTSYAGPDGQTALHAAVMRPEGTYFDKNIIRALLKWNPSLASAMDKAQNTPFHYAALIGNSYAIKQLLSADTKPVYKPNTSGSFPVHLAAEAGNFAVIRELLNSCPDVGELLDMEKKNFLHVAVKKKRMGVIIWACQERINANVVNAKDKDGNTPLHLAVLNSDSEIFAILSKNKTVNPNIRNKAGLSPLNISTFLKDRQFRYSVNPQSSIHRALLTRGAFHNPCQPDISNKIVENSVKIANEARADCPNEREGEEMVNNSTGVDAEMESTKYENMSKSLITGAVLIASATFVAIFTVSGDYRSDNTSHTFIKRKNIFKAFVITDVMAFICAIVSTNWLLYSALSIFHLNHRKFYFQMCTPLLHCAINLFILAFGLGGYIAIAPLSEWLGILILMISGTAILWNFNYFPKFVPLILHAPYF